MSWLPAGMAFVYDFLADDGWELLAGLVVILPLTFLVASRHPSGAGLLLVAGVLLAMTVSLARKLPRSR